MSLCAFERCEEDAVYCWMCCEEEFCADHSLQCSKRPCIVCGCAFTEEEDKSNPYCETCRQVEAKPLECAFPNCPSVFDLTVPSCCSTQYCSNHVKQVTFQKCCSACTIELRCIVCVKMDRCKCKYKYCQDCGHKYHMDKLVDGICPCCHRINTKKRSFDDMNETK